MMQHRNYVLTVGSDYELVSREIDSERRPSYHTFTREDFLSNGIEKVNKIDLLAIYNIASDPVVMQDFISKRTKNSLQQKTNSNEIYTMLMDWVSGLTAGNYAVTKGRMYQMRRRYFNYVCHKLVPCGYGLFNYEDFSKWLKERRKNQ